MPVSLVTYQLLCHSSCLYTSFIKQIHSAVLQYMHQCVYKIRNIHSVLRRTIADFLLSYASNIISTKKFYNKQLNVLLSYLDIVINPLH